MKTEHHLTRIRPNEDCDGCLKLKIEEYGDAEVDAGIVIWSTGLMQNPLVEKLGSKTFDAPPGVTNPQPGLRVRLERDPRTGSIVTDSFLRMRSTAVAGAGSESEPQATGSHLLDDCYVIGDCAVIAGEDTWNLFYDFAAPAPDGYTD